MKMKLKKCRNCKCEFTPSQPLQVVCDWKCASDLAKKKAVEKTNKEFNDWRKTVLPTAHAAKYKKALKDETCKLSRMIDAAFGFTTCIDCGRGFGAQTDAAHFHSRGSNSSLIYNLHNLHSASSQCNQFSDKHKEGYVTGLEKRYGSQYLEMVKNLGVQYPSIKLSAVEVVEKLAVVRKLIRDFETFQFSNAEQARTQLNLIIGIYK